MQFSSYEQRAIPSMVFKYRNQTEWAEISTADLFDNKNVIVFSLPGAFTPTCSSTHVPRFNELWPAFKALGMALFALSIDELSTKGRCDELRRRNPVFEPCQEPLPGQIVGQVLGGDATQLAIQPALEA